MELYNTCHILVQHTKNSTEGFCWRQYVFAFLPTGFGKRLAKHSSNVHLVSTCAVFVSLVQQLSGKTGSKKSDWFTFQGFFEWTSPFLSIDSTQIDT